MLKKTLVTTVLLFALSGCDSDNDKKNSASSVDLPDEKTLIFYNQTTAAQYAYDTDTEISSDLNGDASSNFYMVGQTAGKLLYWPDEYAEGEIDEKVVMLNADYDFAEDGNLSYTDFIYLGHFHDSELAAHSAEEFNPASDSYSAAKAAALVRLNTYLAERNATRAEIVEALSATAPGETLCNFFVPSHHHDEEEEAEGEEAHPHFALSSAGKVYVFDENTSEELESIQSAISLEGADSCTETGSGITGYGEHGILVFSADSQKLYLVDSHGLDYHQHSQWSLGEFLPIGFSGEMMIGMGEGEAHDHDHDE